MPQNHPFEQRVGIFIDVQNMFYAAKHLYGSKLNFTRLLDYVSRGRPLTRAISYVIKTPEIDQSNFITMLRSNGYEIRVKELKQRPDGSAKGDWDMGLALDALAMSDRLDVIAIVSGDGDFVDLVNLLKARGVRVEVYSFPYSTAEDLRHAATEFYQMGPEVVMPIAKNGVRGLNSHQELDGEALDTQPDLFIEAVNQTVVQTN
ncbi:MAG TPA: NYN domain-containing protein [Abditibacterium sp.]